MIKHSFLLLLATLVGATLYSGMEIVGTITPTFPSTFAQYLGMLMTVAFFWAVFFGNALIFGSPGIWLLNKFSRITLPRLILLGILAALPIEFYFARMGFSVARDYNETDSPTFWHYLTRTDSLVDYFIKPGIGVVVASVTYWFLAWRPRGPLLAKTDALPVA